MRAKLLTERHLELLSLIGGCTCSPESTIVEMPQYRKRHVKAHKADLGSITLKK